MATLPNSHSTAGPTPPTVRRPVHAIRIGLLLNLLAEHASDELLAAMADIPGLHWWLLRVCEHRTRPPTHDIVRPLLASPVRPIWRRALRLAARLPE